MQTLILSFLILVALLYVLVVFVATYVSLHPPRVPLWLSPAMLGKKEEGVSLDVFGTNITGWWSDEGTSDLVIVCCHGYLMNRCELLPMMVTLEDLRASWMFFDFRAHGKSGGRTSTMGLEEAKDVAAIVGWIKERKPSARIALYGSSMGGAAAAIALGSDPSLAEGLILDGTYGSMDSAGRGWWDFIGGKWLGLLMTPTVWLGRLMLGFNPADVVIGDYLRRSSHVPVLQLMGADDRVVSRREYEDNALASGTLTWSKVFADCDHGEARFKHPDAYQNSIRQFVNEALLHEGGDGHNP